MKRWFIGLLAVALAAVTATSAFAQGGGASSTGTIQGRVADAQGAVPVSYTHLTLPTIYSV